MKINLAEKWIIRRIQEFPMIYPHAYAVIAACIVGKKGRCFWTPDGSIDYTLMFYKNGSNKAIRYPKVISWKVAKDMSLGYFFEPAFYILQGTDGIINNIPDNANSDWLKILHIFLKHFERYTPEVVEKIAEVFSFVIVGDFSRKEEFRRQYEEFLGKILNWEARISEVINLQKEKV